MTREELDLAHEAVTIKHRRMLEDNFKAHLPVWLDELAAIAEQHAQDAADGFLAGLSEQPPVLRLPDITSGPESALDRLARLDDAAPATAAPEAPPARATTPRRPAARKRTT